jgi:transcriptional regulator with XRE-family HTH domain
MNFCYSWLVVVQTAPHNGSNLPAELRDARREAGLTQEQLACLAGCSVTSVRNVEQGNPPRGRSHVLSIIRAILVDLNDEGRPPQGALVKASVDRDRYGSG